MRTSSALALLVLLAGCGDPPTDTKVLAKVEAEQRAEAADDGRIRCALAGETELKPDCMVDRAQGSDGLVLIVRHPDGGFRRLLVTDDGRGVIAADGAEPAEVAVVDAGEIEVRIGGDVYRLPATVKPGVADKK